MTFIIHCYRDSGTHTKSLMCINPEEGVKAKDQKKSIVTAFGQDPIDSVCLIQCLLANVEFQACDSAHGVLPVPAPARLFADVFHKWIPFMVNANDVFCGFHLQHVLPSFDCSLHMQVKMGRPAWM